MKDLVFKSIRLVARPFFGRGLFDLPILRGMAAWYKSRCKPEYVTIEGSRLYLNPQDDSVSGYIAVHGYWEKMETEVVRRYVKPGMRTLDVGANVGYFTLLMSSLVGERGRVTAFEPDVTNFGLLERSVGEMERKNVDLVRSAAWSSTGELKLYLAPENLGDHRCFPSDEERPHYTIPASAIDEVLGDGGTIDFIKMDIQGAEGHALRGMARTLERKPPVAMILEFWPSGLAQAGTPPREVWERLVELGYRMERINDEEERIYPITFDEIMAFCDLDWKFINMLCILDR